MSRRHLNSPPVSPTSASAMSESVLRRTTASIVLLAAAAFAHGPALHCGYIWDDDSYVTQNLNLRDAAGLYRIWCQPHTSPQYYPLVFTSFWIQYQLHELQPGGYHLVNILLHGTGACVLWFVLTHLKVPCGWLIAVIFAVHPVHTESVAWITERKNVLSGFFYLTAMLAYLRFHRDSTASGSRYLYATSFLCFVAAVLSKTVTCSLPAALLVILWAQGTVEWKADIQRLLPFFAIGIVMATATVHLERTHVGAQGTEFNFSFAERVLIAGRAVVFYATKIIVPANLMFFYPRWQIDVSNTGQWLYPLGLLSVAIVLWFGRRNRGRLPAACLMLFVGTLFPALGFFNVYPFRFSFVADHFQYLASIPVIVAIVVGLWYVTVELMNRPWAGAAAAMCLVPLLVLQAQQQCARYRNEETLWIDTVRKNPNAFAAHGNLGTLYLRKRQYEDAVHHLETSVRLKPANNINAHAALAVARGEIEANAGNLDTALAILTDGCEQFSTSAQIDKLHYDRGIVLEAVNRPDEAIDAYWQAAKCNPAVPAALLRICVIREKLGDIESAVQGYRLVLKQFPNQKIARARLSHLTHETCQP